MPFINAFISLLTLIVVIEWKDYLIKQLMLIMAVKSEAIHYLNKGLCLSGFNGSIHAANITA